MKNILLILLLLCSFPVLAAKKSKLDPFLAHTLSSSAILNTEQIYIPDFPKAHNPSLIPYHGGYLLSFRTIQRNHSKNPPREDDSYIGLVKLNRKFKPVKKSAQLLNITSHSQGFTKTAEDARLFTIGNRIFILFNDLPIGIVHHGFALYLAELIEVQGEFQLKGFAIPLHYSNATHIEKNWSPFVSYGKVYLIYSDDPRIILELDIDTGNCLEVTRASSLVQWQWGQIRGGTPALPIDDQLITFFHSSFPAETIKKRKNPKEGLNYVMGAYLFDKEPPFSIRAMTPMPLGDEDDYNEDNERKVVFPTGIVIEKNLIHVSWGKNDKLVMITTFDKKKLLSSMHPIFQ